MVRQAPRSGRTRAPSWLWWPSSFVSAMCALTSGDLHHALRHMQTIFITQIYDGYGTVIVESTDVRDQSARRGLLSHVGSHREDVSRETVLLQAFKEEGDKGNIRAVRYLSGSATARKHTSNSTPAIDDSCTRVSTFRERPRLKRARQHTATSLDYSPGFFLKALRLIERMLFRHPIVSPVVQPRLKTMMVGSPLSSTFLGFGLRISSFDRMPRN